MKYLKCNHCGKILGEDIWWSSVPGAGNLCNPCHDIWLEKRDEDALHSED